MQQSIRYLTHRLRNSKKIIRILVYLAIIILALSPSACLADEISVTELKEVNEIMINTKDFLKDANGKLCALMRVCAPPTKIGFEGNIIGNVEYKVNEHWVFLSPGTKMLKVKYEGLPSLMIDLSKYLGSGVRSKGIYQLRLFIPDDSNSILSANLSASEQLLFGKKLLEKNNDTITAIKWLRMAAENGNGEAMCVMGDLCKAISNSKTSTVKRILHMERKDSSLYWYHKSASAGFPEGMCKAAGSIKWWKNLKDTTYVRINLEKACKKGYAPAFARLGKYYESLLINYDIDNIKGYDKIFAKTDPIRILSLRDEKDNHRQSDLDLAEYWYTEGLKHDEANCAYELGNFYRHHKYSLSKEECLQKSFEFWNRAASLNHLEALRNVASCYYNGEGVRKDEKKANMYLERAIEEGYYNPHSYVVLASRYNLSKQPALKQKAYALCKRIVTGKKIYEEKTTSYTTDDDRYDAAGFMIDIEKQMPSLCQEGYTVRVWLVPSQRGSSLTEEIELFLNKRSIKWIDEYSVLTDVNIGDQLTFKHEDFGEYSISITKDNRDLKINLDMFNKN